MKLSILVVLVACGDNTPPLPDAVVPTGRTITGTAQTRYVAPGGEVHVPVDFSASTIAAITLPSLATLPGAGAADGTFAIPNVPEGAFYLQVDANYIEMTGDTIDLGYDELGRPDVVAATQPTPLRFDVANLASWQMGDQLELTSPDSGTMAFDISSAAVNPPAVAATSLAGFTYDLSNASYRALFATSDHATLTQLATHGFGPIAYQSAARTFTAPPFAITNGGNASLAGTFTTVPETSAANMSVDLRDFDGLLRVSFPQALGYPIYAIQVLPEAASRGLYHDAPDALQWLPGYGTPLMPLHVSGPYGDPYPAAWTRVESFIYYDVMMEGAVQVDAQLQIDRVQSTQPFTPVVGPVRAPMIDGGNFYLSHAKVGETPNLTWTAPSLGTPTAYTVRVDRVSGSNLQTVAVLDTPSTSVVIPPGIMHTGSSYVFEIDAAITPIDITKQPFTTGLPDAHANVMSQIMTP
jgi:hypothetical protein